VIDGLGTGDEVPGGKGLFFKFPEAVQVAVDSSGGVADGDIYVNQEGAKVIDVFAEDGSYLGQLSEYNEDGFKALNEPCGVTVDPSGNVYVGDYSGKVHKFEPSANPPLNADNSANLPFSQNCTLAAGAGATDGFIFPAHLNASVAKLDSTSGAEAYEVDPGPTTTVTVDPATGHLFSASGSEVKEFDASGPLAPTLLTKIAPGGERVNGIAVDKTTGRIYLARKGSAQIEVWGAAAALPVATTEAATTAAGSVTLHGTVSADGGPPVTCVFEYVEGHAKGFAGASTAPCSPAGPFTGSSTEAVSAEIKGLPEAGYRFRLIASNENGSSEGATEFFNNVEEPGLPDGRAYEMVSPTQKGGEVIPPEPFTQLGSSCGDCLPGENYATQPMQSSSDGESVLYEGQPFSGGLAAGGNEYVAERSTGGWASQSLSSPTITGRYEAFSPDLSRGILFQGSPALSPEAPARGGSAFGNLYLRQGGEMQPLITEEPPNRDPGNFAIRFGGANAGTASSPAFEHVAFAADDALTAAVPGIAPAAPEVEAPFQNNCLIDANCNLYEWASGQLRLVNVLPGNAGTASNAVIGSGELLDHQQAPDVDHAISDNGSRIFWSSEETGHVYVRIDGKETLEVPGPGSFLTASPDGSKVLLSDGQVFELNGAENGYEASADLTLDEGHVHQGGFAGILGAADDLSRVYFVDTGALTGEGKENANGEHAEEGKHNLYAWHEGALGFIGKLRFGSQEDNGFGLVGHFGAWKPSPTNRTAHVSADGNYLAFMSKAPLTGYDNRHNGSSGRSCDSETEPHPGPPCREVFVYSAATESLSCASCNPTGEQPIGPSNLSLLRPSENAPPFPQPHNLSSNGRLFFESRDVLSPRDLNGHIQDVYEWEPNGIGSCKRANGCDFLISSGNSPNDSLFLDATPSGNDAFFITREQLLLRDKDDQLDLYDARVNGGIAENPPRPCASGESCLGPLSSPPEQPGAASSTFSGPGNEKPKPKKHHKKRKHKSHKRAASHNRGGQK
jgi:hypothetical protein